MVGVPAGTQNNNSNSAKFNEKAVVGYYEHAGTLVREPSVLTNIAGWFVDNADVSIDKTIKSSTVKTNLEAIHAGFKDSSPQVASDIERFGNVILKHKELSEGMDAMLKDEGANMMPVMQKMLIGEGKMNIDQFEKMMENPAYRKTVGNMFKRVGTNELGAEYAARFTTDAMDAANNPDDKKKREKFLQTAKDGGVDTSKLEGDVMKNMLKDFWNNPDKTIVGMMDKLDLPPEMKNSLTGILSSLAGFFKEVVGHYAFGNAKEPGLIEIAQNAYTGAQQSGKELRAEYGSKDPEPAAQPQPQPFKSQTMFSPG